MRPPNLNPLFRPTTALSGVGPRIAKLIERLAGPKVVDLLWHLPREIIDRRVVDSLVTAETGKTITATLTVIKHEPSRVRRQPYRVHCTDGKDDVILVFFHARDDYLRRILPEGQIRLVSGTVERFRGSIQITHPDYILVPKDAKEMPLIEPVYPLTEGLTLKTLGKAVRTALVDLPNLPEWQDRAFLRQQQWPTWREALHSAHTPEDLNSLSPETPARARLAYDELLANQLALQIMRAKMKNRPGRAITGDGRLSKRVIETLPFTLTGSQRTAIAEISADLRMPSAMLRLLQGDVGSGKTIVALLTMLEAVECGGQAALMAPTEILARQHLETIKPIATKLGINCTVLTGREKGKARQTILEGLSSGEIAIAIGTHALFQDTVKLKDLMIVVIDEQHRFGVHQRLSLTTKGKGVDVLVMTATPIPRTLLLTSYGDLEASQLRQKPRNRKPIDTRTVSLDRLSEVVDGLERRLKTGAKAYWVCPLIEESESIDLAAAEERYAQLRARFGDRVEVVHGRMKGVEKDAAMSRFLKGKADILVATTVIEVGIDVPAATIMVIEHAERFGLAQLHQLRGRVGRGVDASICLLLYGSPLGETAKARLKIMRETQDGFQIAEEDLRLRGGGEILGTRQSGLPDFRLADLSVHGALLAAARDDAKLILNRDPDLQDKRGKSLRVLLYLFERDAAIMNLRSG
ncbi:MAG: ATP-dependent DNA helicase RecG [Alphaproteobacteria bacterium MarineAlpha4_Bin2]|nr:MAG: ATP-dependent DNA helicase RecG [Alphaproteobacteria bacterium MarineAlpha4_Bin2]